MADAASRRLRMTTLGMEDVTSDVGQAAFRLQFCTDAKDAIHSGIGLTGSDF